MSTVRVFNSKALKMPVFSHSDRMIPIDIQAAHLGYLLKRANLSQTDNLRTTFVSFSRRILKKTELFFRQTHTCTTGNAKTSAIHRKSIECKKNSKQHAADHVLKSSDKFSRKLLSHFWVSRIDWWCKDVKRLKRAHAALWWKTC